ncbi:MAG: hypothetical protein Q9180_006625, partial [Flavoplaca navasiana]
MHPDSRMLQWGQLDKYDLEAERDAEAQREDFERRLPQVQKNRSTGRGMVSASDRTVQHRQSETTAVQTTDVTHDSKHQPAVKKPVLASRPVAVRQDQPASDDKVFKSTIQTPPVDTVRCLEHLDSSSDDALSDAPSNLGDMPPSDTQARSAAPSITRSAVQPINIQAPAQPRRGRPGVLNSTSTVRGGAHTKVNAHQYALLQQQKERPTLLDQSAAAPTEPTDLDVNDRIVPGQGFQNLTQTRWNEVIQGMSAAWRRYQSMAKDLIMPAAFYVATTILRRPLKWGLWLVLDIAIICLVVLLVIMLCLLIGTSLTTLIITATDNVGAAVCQVPGIDWVCSCLCSSSSFLSLYVFSATCSRYPVLIATIEAEPSWETVSDFRATDNLPQELSYRVSQCKLFVAKVRRLRPGFAIPPESQDKLLEDQEKLCTHLEQIYTRLPGEYQRAMMFSEALLYQINLTQTEIENAQSMSGNPRNALIEQQTINSKIPVIISTWQRKLAALNGPGAPLEDEVKDAQNLGAQLQEDILDTTDRTIRARKAKMKKWPIIRRAGRAIGLFR